MNTAEFLDRIASAGTLALDSYQALIVEALRGSRMADADTDALLAALAERRAALRTGRPVDAPLLAKTIVRRKALAKTRRSKTFGLGPRRPMDRNAKARLMVLARALKAKREGDGRHYGEITAKTVDVLEALLFEFHNARTGQCNPSYERIASKARCARSTAQEAVRSLEGAGLLTWVNRIERRRTHRSTACGRIGIRVVRTSNAYCFADPLSRPIDPASSTDFQGGTSIQESLQLCVEGVGRLQSSPRFSDRRVRCRKAID